MNLSESCYRTKWEISTDIGSTGILRCKTMARTSQCKELFVETKRLTTEIPSQLLLPGSGAKADLRISLDACNWRWAKTKLMPKLRQLPRFIHSISISIAAPSWSLRVGLFPSLFLNQEKVFDGQLRLGWVGSTWRKYFQISQSYQLFVDFYLIWLI